MKRRLLVSCRRHGTTDLAVLAGDPPADLLAVPGDGVSLRRYAAWLNDWRDVLTAYTNLCTPGSPRQSLANLEALERRGLSPVPVFRMGDPWPLLRTLAGRHRYLALDGFDGASRPRRSWVTRVFSAAPNVRFHAVELTDAEVLCRHPFYSISATHPWWPYDEAVTLWDPTRGRLCRSRFRDPRSVYRHRRLYDDHGLRISDIRDPSFATKGGSRDYEADRGMILAASARAWMRMGEWLAVRHAVVPPPLPRHADLGTKLYLAAQAPS